MYLNSNVNLSAVSLGIMEIVYVIGHQTTIPICHFRLQNWMPSMSIIKSTHCFSQGRIPRINVEKPIFQNISAIFASL